MAMAVKQNEISRTFTGICDVTGIGNDIKARTELAESISAGLRKFGLDRANLSEAAKTYRDSLLGNMLSMATTTGDHRLAIDALNASCMSDAPESASRVMYALAQISDNAIASNLSHGYVSVDATELILIQTKAETRNAIDAVREMQGNALGRRELGASTAFDVRTSIEHWMALKEPKRGGPVL